jgi:hypothetical protein
MRKAIYAVFASAMFAGSFFVASSLSAEVEARGSVPGAKADRADARPLARACSGNARLVSLDEAEAAAKVKAKPAR